MRKTDPTMEEVREAVGLLLATFAEHDIGDTAGLIACEMAQELFRKVLISKGGTYIVDDGEELWGEN